MHGRKPSPKLAERLMAFIDQWNETANPFNWTSKSVAKVTAKCQAKDSKPLPMAAHGRVESPIMSCREPC
jgi:hypothetical protein